MLLDQARQIAQRIVEELSPHCERIDIAGSIRREKEVVKDIEIVCTPKMTTPIRRSSGWCKAVAKIGTIMKGKKLNENKFIKIKRSHQLPSGSFVYIDLDLFIAPPKNYGMYLLVRTGSAKYSAHIFTLFNKKGYKSSEGIHRSISDGSELTFTEETAIYSFLNIPYLRPELRSL